MLCFYLGGCKKSIMLKEKVVYVCCRPRESFLQSVKESVGIGIEDEWNTRSFG